MGSVYGKNIRISIFGQSHSAAIGVVVDGLPAGHKIDLEELRAFMRRRAPGSGGLGTARKEADEVEILAGLADGALCGGPLPRLLETATPARGLCRPCRHAEAGPRGLHRRNQIRRRQDRSGGGHFRAG
jgi:chorismate synthase